MADFSIRSDSVNVEEIMREIRARIREKRGVDYTDLEIRGLAAVKLETFLDPTKVRSDLLEQFQQLQRQQEQAPDVALDDSKIFGSARPLARWIRKVMRPVLKLLLNPRTLVIASHVDETMRRQAALFYELVHNLVVETTRLSIEVNNLKMRVESLSSRLDFDERRARALEGVVQYRPATPAQEAAPGAARKDEDEAEAESGASRGRRRRRRRGRRGGGQGGGAEERAGTGETAQASGEIQPRAEAPSASEAQPADRSVEHASPPEAAPEVTTAPASTRSQAPPHEAGRAPEQDPGDQEPGG